MTIISILSVYSVDCNFGYSSGKIIMLMTIRL